MKYVIKHLEFVNKKATLFFVLYLGVLVAATIGIMPLRYQIPFLLYAIFIFAVLWGPLHQPKESEALINEEKYKKFFLFLLFFSLAFLLISRLLPFIRWGEAPLGYDTGSYLQYFALITSIGFIERAVGSAIAYVMWFPFYFFGLSGMFTIHALHFFHQILTAAALYFFIRSFYPQKKDSATTTIALFLFALSINQFMGYWWMFYKQSAAIPFLIIALGFMLRRSWFFMIVFTVLGAMIHLPTVAPFVIAFVPVCIGALTLKIIRKEPVTRTIGIFMISALVPLLLIFLLARSDLISAIEHLKNLRGLATNAPPFAIQQFKGLFIPFDTFRMNIIFYLPFAFIGLLTLRSWHPHRNDMRTFYIIALALTSLILVSFPFIYQHRFLIVFDILVIVFATIPATIFIKKFLIDGRARVIVALFFFGAVIFSSLVIWNQPPQLYPDEREELRAIQQMRKPGDYAMATDAIYTPWVFAFTNFQETIAPGWLYWQRWDLKMWKEFWYGKSDDRRHELLSIYGDNNIYMFVGKRQTPHPNLQKFLETDPHIKKISPHIWRYSPR